MDGYTSSTYGDAFADVYDDWYRDVSDVGATVRFLARLAGPAGSVLELGVGTGRLAIPLAGHVGSVVGIDSSERMLARLAGNDPLGTVRAVRGDMATELPPGPHDVVVCAYNTLFNLLTHDAQQRCIAAVAERLAPTGAFVVEAFVPETPPARDERVAVRALTVDSVVLSVSVHDPERQRLEGQYIEISEAGGVKLRPWAVRWASPAQLDAMAAAAGLELTERWSGFHGETYDADSERHVSVYRHGRGA